MKISWAELLYCRKPQCKNFIYVGQTLRRFCDRFTDHKTYVTTKRLNTASGAHFILPGHSEADMVPTILEQVYPKNDEFLRLTREKNWINNYQAIDYGSNTKF